MEVIYLITAKQKNKIFNNVYNNNVNWIMCLEHSMQSCKCASMYATTKKKKKKKKKRRRKKETTTRAWEMGIGSSMDSDLFHE